jgi:ParB-like chromosome segregation protein Spo0J
LANGSYPALVRRRGGWEKPQYAVQFVFSRKRVSNINENPIEKTSEVRPYENNPRKNDQAVEAVAKSIREFGFRQPIVVDADGVIICGHTRYKAALKIGLDEIPVHVATDLTPEQIKAYRIADNQTASLAEWNYELLPIESADLQACN